MDFEKLRIAFKTLDELDENDELAYDTAYETFKSIQQLPVFIHKMPAGTKLFRTRTCTKNDFFVNISDISVTPSQFVKNFARCNCPGQSIFYCSENRPTSFMELVEYWLETTNIGDKIFVTVGRWETIAPLNVVLITTPDKDKRISQYDIIHGKAYDDAMKELSKEKVEVYNAFYRYMFERFRKPAKHDLRTYLITTAYTNLALTTAGEKAEGISYPSVPYNGEGINFALKEDYAKNKLTLLNALWTEFEVRPHKEDKRNFMDVARADAIDIDSSNNLINW